MNGKENKKLKVMKINKYIYLFVIQGNYGYGDGWEDLTAAEDYREARGYLKDYRENEPDVSHRMINRRELNK